MTDLPKLGDLQTYTKGVYVRKADVVKLLIKHAAAHHRIYKEVVDENMVNGVKLTAKQINNYAHYQEGARDAVLDLFSEKKMEVEKYGK